MMMMMIFEVEMFTAMWFLMEMGMKVRCSDVTKFSLYGHCSVLTKYTPPCL